MVPGCILKVNMVNPGRSCAIKYTVEEIAEANVQVLVVICYTMIRQVAPIPLHNWLHLFQPCPYLDPIIHLTSPNQLQFQH